MSVCSVLKIVVVAAVLGSTGPLSAQAKREFLNVTNRDASPATILIRGSDSQGRRLQWVQADEKILPNYRMPLLLQRYGFEPFDVRIVQAGGDDTLMSNLRLCTMMIDCKRNPAFSRRTIDAVVQGKDTSGPPVQRTYNVGVAWDFVDLEFRPQSDVQQLLRPVLPSR